MPKEQDLYITRCFHFFMSYFKGIVLIVVRLFDDEVRSYYNDIIRSGIAIVRGRIARAKER